MTIFSYHNFHVYSTSICRREGHTSVKIIKLTPVPLICLLFTFAIYILLGVAKILYNFDCTTFVWKSLIVHGYMSCDIPLTSFVMTQFGPGHKPTYTYILHDKYQTTFFDKKRYFLGGMVNFSRRDFS